MAKMTFNDKAIQKLSTKSRFTGQDYRTILRSLKPYMAELGGIDARKTTFSKYQKSKINKAAKEAAAFLKSGQVIGKLVKPRKKPKESKKAYDKRIKEFKEQHGQKDSPFYGVSMPGSGDGLEIESKVIDGVIITKNTGYTGDPFYSALVPVLESPPTEESLMNEFYIASKTAEHIKILSDDLPRNIAIYGTYFNNKILESVITLDMIRKSKENGMLQELLDAVFGYDDERAEEVREAIGDNPVADTLISSLGQIQKYGALKDGESGWTGFLIEQGV